MSGNKSYEFGAYGVFLKRGLIFAGKNLANMYGVCIFAVQKSKAI